MKAFRLLTVGALAAGGLMLGSPVTASPPPSGAAAIWSFNELDGLGNCDADVTVPVVDHSGNGNDALINPAAPTAARATPPAASLDDPCSLNLGGLATQYASAGDIDEAGDFSVTAWSYWEPSTAPTLAYLVSKDDATTAENNYNLFMGTWPTSTAGALFSITFNGTPVAATPTKGTAGCDAGGCWVKGETVVGQQYSIHRFTGVYSSGTMSVYVDGQLDGQVAITGGTPKTNDQAVWIGQRKYGTGSGWNGRLDDVRIYDRALSTDEVAALANYSLFNVALTPKSATNMSGQSHTVTATVTPDLGYIPVDFAVTGRNTASGIEWTDNTSVTSFTYTDNNGSAGNYDTIAASVNGGVADTAAKYWVNAPDQSFCTMPTNEVITSYAVMNGLLYSSDIHFSYSGSGPIASQTVCLYFANVSGGTLNILGTPPDSQFPFAYTVTPGTAATTIAPQGFSMVPFANQTDFLGSLTVTNIKFGKNGLPNNTHVVMTFNDGTNTFTVPIELHFKGGQ